MTDGFGVPQDSRGRAFGDIERRTHEALHGQSPAMYEAARNLLDKAVVALEIPRADKAMEYVRRAGRLPHDDDGGASPLSLAAHMYALRSVLDVYESGRGVWVDAADILLDPTSSWKPLAVADFRHVLTVVRADYETTPAEARHLGALIGGRKVATVREMQALAGEELSAVAMDLLEIVVAYKGAAKAILAERGTDY